MPKRHSPRRGSLQFWPRKRAKKAYARIRSWAKLDDSRLLASAGYKAGMTHVLIKNKKSKTGGNLFVPVTIIECPPVKVLGIRFYKDGKAIGEELSKKLDKELQRKIKLSKKTKEIKDYDDIRLIIHTQPGLTKIGKKRPEIFEIEISGGKDKKLSYSKNLLDKEIKLNDVFKEGQYIDVHSVTKGKGFQGTVKRFGVIIRQHKSEKTKRGVGSLGPFQPRRVSFRVPQPGKMGYHLRTEYNKHLIKIGSDGKEINQKGGMKHYGIIKNDYILIKGGVAGSNKRMIIMTQPIRQKEKDDGVDIIYISKESKQ